MDWCRDNPLSKTEEETTNANEALWAFWRLGPRRKLTDLSELHQTARDYTNLHSYDTLKRWSSQHNWQARIARMSEIQNQAYLDAIGERVTQQLDRECSATDDLWRIWNEMTDSRKEQALSLLKEFSRLGRLSLGMSTEQTSTVQKIEFVISEEDMSANQGDSS